MRFTWRADGPGRRRKKDEYLSCAWWGERNPMKIGCSLLDIGYSTLSRVKRPSYCLPPGGFAPGQPHGCSQARGSPLTGDQMYQYPVIVSNTARSAFPSPS